jgi:DNA-binding beta-propeller fold protein YncE
MPNDLALDQNGNLYVVDSRSGCVLVYDSSQDYVRTIGASNDAFAGMEFPSSVCVAYRPDPDVAGATYGEVFVADQGTGRIYVFEPDGDYLREFGGPIEESYWGAPKWKGLFARIQGLAFDGDDRLHALDCYMGNVQILDPDTGDYSDSYFTGDDAGTLKIPLDLVITSAGNAIVTNAERGRLEVFDSVP